MRKPEPQPEDNTDPFDRLYKRWAEHAIGKRTDPPSRERWDQIVSFLLQSEDPERSRRYSYIESYGSETLGADAYQLWERMPEYTENRSVPAATWPELNAYEELHRGSMARLMQAQGKGEQYAEIIERQRHLQDERRARVRKAQVSLYAMGCAGIGLLGLMVLTVLLIIALRGA